MFENLLNIFNRGYRGNTNLKRAGTQIEWTPELIREYQKCMNDVIYFAENYFKIVTEDGLVPIKLREYQKDILRSMRDNRYTIANQSRQSGKTEMYRIFLTHYILFNEYKTVLLFANKADTAREILGKLQISYQHLPIWLQLSIKEFNKGSFTLENGSRIIAFSTADDAARGYTGHCICIDEMAHIDNWEDFYSSVYPVISAGKETKMVITSTPKGINQFYDFWQAAQLKDKDPSAWNGFYPFLVPWFMVPGRDEEWKENTLKGMNYNYEKFDQEFEVNFIGSSGTLITGSALSYLKENALKPTSSDDSIKFYEYPIKEREEWSEDEKETKTIPPNRYAIVCDVSRGKGLDYSTFSVFDITTMPYKQVCVYRNNEIAPRDYADIIHKIAMFYNQAWVLVEINDIGEQIGDILINELEYENTICTESAGKGGKKIVFGGKKTDKGIRTTNGVKMTGCLILKLLIEQNKIKIPDEETVMELMSFIKVRNSYKADDGKHDDLVMTLVLFAWLTDNSFFKDMTDINTFSNLREKTLEEIESELYPLGWMESKKVEREYQFYDISYNLNNGFSLYDERTMANPIVLPDF